MRRVHLLFGEMPCSNANNCSRKAVTKLSESENGHSLRKTKELYAITPRDKIACIQARFNTSELTMSEIYLNEIL